VAIKVHEGKVHGFDLTLIAWWLKIATGLANASTTLVIACIAGLALAGAARAIVDAHGPPQTQRVALVTLASAIAIPAYILSYGFAPLSSQPWYLGNILLPLAIVLAALLSLFELRLVRVVTVAAALAAIVLASRPLLALWPNQVAMLDAGRSLAADTTIAAPVGAWNAGILAYFSGRPIVNLDGLVNDDIEPYARSGTLAGYIDRRHIGYVIDFPVMLLSSEREAEGGYPCGVLTRRLEPLRRIIDDPRYQWGSFSLTVYKVLRRPPLYNGGDITFGRTGNALSFLGCGWSLPQADGTATAGNVAELVVPLATRFDHNVTMRLTTTPAGDAVAVADPAITIEGHLLRVAFHNGARPLFVRRVSFERKHT
jgi:hypothetical protein